MSSRRTLFVVVLALDLGGCGQAATSTSSSSPTATESTAAASPNALSPSPSAATPVPTPEATPLPTLASTSKVATTAPNGAIPVVMTAVGDSEHSKPVYQPDQLTAKAGTVIFFLQNVPPSWASPDHNMWIGPSIGQALAGSADVNRNESVIFTVNGVTPGTYAFWCSILAPSGATHASFGMVGTLTITP